MTVFAHLAVAAALLTHASAVSSECVSQVAAVVVVNIGVVVGIVLFRQMVLRFGTAADQIRVESALAAQRVLALSQQDRARDVRARSVLTNSGSLLRSLAAGAAEAHDPVIRAECGTHEDYLRSILHVDPDLGDLGDALVAAVDSAYRRGVHLTVRSTEPMPLPGRESIALVESTLDHVIGSLPDGGEAVVALFAHGDSGGLMTIVAPDDDAPLTTLDPRQPEVGAHMTCVSLADQVLVEVRWESSTRAAGARRYRRSVLPRRGSPAPP